MSIPDHSAAPSARAFLDEARKRFASFYDTVKADHARVGVKRGHDLVHDVTVGQYAHLIAPDERTAEKAWAAALLHSSDYRVARGDTGACSRLVSELLGHLPQDYFTAAETAEIHEAVMRHGEKNSPNQSLTLQVLQDADRLSILMPGTIFRIGQGYPGLPAFELQHLSSNNPQSTYADPCSCLDDFRNCCSEYRPQFRLPKAIEIVDEQMQEIELVIRMIQKGHERLGLKDYAL